MSLIKISAVQVARQRKIFFRKSDAFRIDERENEKKSEANR
jgi:hypothetical protein